MSAITDYASAGGRVGSVARKPREWEVWHDHHGWRAYHPALDGEGLLVDTPPYDSLQSALYAIDWYELRYWAKLNDWRYGGVRYSCAVCRAPAYSNGKGGIFHVTTGTTHCE